MTLGTEADLADADGDEVQVLNRIDASTEEQPAYGVPQCHLSRLANYY